MKTFLQLTDDEVKRCVELLSAIVDPEVEQFGSDIEEAQTILGLRQEMPKAKRGRPLGSKGKNGKQARLKRGYVAYGVKG
jgi:hypothetical protein